MEGQPDSLIHLFTLKLASFKPEKDLLSYSTTGKTSYGESVKCRILKSASNSRLSFCKNKLKTFAKARVSKRKYDLVEKEKHPITKRYKHMIAEFESSNKPVMLVSD